MKNNNAKFIWYDRVGEGRNLYGMFRKTFIIRDDIKSAEINIFADTSYQLFINGKFIEFGPVRFDPRFPMYDHHDLSPYLIEGLNTIGVLVNKFGYKTYKSIPNRAGFIAWGEIESEYGDNINLDTFEGSWRCMEAKAYSGYAPKISFALNTIDLYNEGLEEHGWKDTGFNDQHWLKAVEIERQESWGELVPRSIPYMRGDIINLNRVKEVVPLINNVDLYSFSLPIPHYFEENSKEFSEFIAFSTWVYSPVDQKVNVGVFWGEGWLNGEALDHGVDCVNRSMVIMQSWDLKCGWNYYFGKVGVYFDILNQYFAIPKDKGILLAADKKDNSIFTFRHSHIITTEEYETYVKDKPLPFTENEDLGELKGWVYVTKDKTAQSPCRETSIDLYGDAIETISPENLEGYVFEKGLYPDGFSITFDLDNMRLIIPEIKMEGVAGATIDITYTEHLCEDNVHFVHMHNYSLGDRVICSSNTIDWMPTNPRGCRYFKITVRNNKEDVIFKTLKLRSANYPVESSGYFTCSDSALNEIWKMGQKTLIANREDAYVDCSGRERGMYGRDTIIQYHVNLATFGDHALMNRCMELYGQSPDDTGKFRAVYPNSGDYTISDFALNILEGYLSYYENTGDINRIKKDWKAIVNNLQWFHNLADERKDMLLDSEWNLRPGVSSHYGGFHGDLGIVPGYMDNTGIHCVFSCTYLIALKSVAVLARALNENEDLLELERRIIVLEKSIPEAFWNEKLGCYADNTKATTYSIHASLFAIRAGVVDEEKLPRIRSYINNQFKSLFANGYDPTGGVFISPSFAFYIFDGLYRAGLERIAEIIMKEGWGWMLAKGLKTCPEYFETHNSLCHAWSASPTYYLSKNVLGVNFPKAPNMDYVEIAVKTHGVTHAEGAYPHPRGLIEIKWHMEEGKRIFDYVKGPDNVKIKIIS